jgi:hypothetical protein
MDPDDFTTGDLVQVGRGGVNGGAHGTVMHPDPAFPDRIRVQLVGVGTPLYFLPHRLRIIHHPAHFPFREEFSCSR